MNEQLLARVRAHLDALDGVTEKGIVGGTGFSWRGNLVCGVMADDLLVRLPRSELETLVGEDGARPMTMGGRASKGWLLVPASALGGETALRAWLDRAITYAATLPPK